MSPWLSIAILMLVHFVALICAYVVGRAHGRQEERRRMEIVSRKYNSQGETTH